MTVTVPIAKVAKLNPPTPRELFDHPEREVSFVPMAQLGEDGRLRNGEARPVGELLQGYTYFADGDVIVAKITPCLQNGKAAYVEKLKGGHGFGSTEFHVIRPSPALDGRYLFYMVWNPTFRHFGEQRFTGSAGQKRMPTSAVAEFQIPLPYPDDPKRSLAQQKRIAAILDKADAIRRRRQEAARLTDQLIPSLFYDMFGDLAKYQPVLLSELRDEFRYGTSVKSAAEGYPALRIPNVIRGKVDWNDIKLVPVDAGEFERLRLANGDLLFVRTNGNPDYVGRCAVFEPQDAKNAGYDADEIIYASYLIRARVYRSKLNPHYLQRYLETVSGRQALRERCRTSAGQYNINTDGLGGLPIPLPPIDRQNDFESRLWQLYELQSKYAALSSEADDLFNSLVQRAFRGEL